jgi:hypothetical protein
MYSTTDAEFVVWRAAPHQQVGRPVMNWRLQCKQARASCARQIRALMVSAMTHKHTVWTACRTAVVGAPTVRAWSR